MMPTLATICPLASGCVVIIVSVANGSVIECVALQHSSKWYFWATHLRLMSFLDATRTLKRHETGLLSFFALSPLTPGPRNLKVRANAIRVSAR